MFLCKRSEINLSHKIVSQVNIKVSTIRPQKTPNMSSPSLTTESAIRMNLRGVHHMESSRFAAAINEFSRALTTVKAVLSQQEDPMDDCEHCCCDTVQKLAFQFSDDDDEEEEHEDEDTTMMQIGQPEDQPFIFQSAIIVTFSPNVSPQAPEDFQSLVKFSAAILFNLALSYHLAAMEASSDIKQKKLLKKALTFYKLAYTMMQDTHNNGVMETMAIANNLGHVQLTVGDMDKAKQCYEHLLSTIMFVTDCGDRQSIRHFDGFFHSVQTVVLSSHKQAAQAA